ncbi:melanocortin-2 receptor accessory protein 2 [Protopterus annectens]|uniref:melanocortin-2 receptor accessory protein 2 n=1 Tax=Protopterus annectens TaxID=7888 RepID=UPI001CF99E6F|nr:melanocortin-2 receptor accessory protein 2 [Protopterus annectens]
MSEVGRVANKTSQQQTQSKSEDYIWSYEYYDYEPVSFEGLKAHRYSIVIGFWVGLAVFVIFMFFVLTLLTKTGAPHQESREPSEKRCRMNSFVADFGRPPEADQVFSHQANEEARSLFHCYINEVDHMERTKHSKKATNLEDNDLHIQEPHRHCKLDDMACLTKFNIPNFVVSDQCSSVSDDDLLIYEPPITLEKQTIKDA